jgi:hypothetical protein
MRSNKYLHVYLYTGCFFIFVIFYSQFLLDLYIKPGHMIHFFKAHLNRILFNKKLYHETYLLENKILLIKN